MAKTDSETKNLVVDFFEEIGKVGIQYDIDNNENGSYNKVVFGVNYLEALLDSWLDEENYQPEKGEDEYKNIFSKIRELSRVSRDKGWLTPKTLRARTRGLILDETSGEFIHEEE